MKKIDKKVSNFNKNNFRVKKVSNGYEVSWYSDSFFADYADIIYIFKTKEELISWLNTNVDEIKE